MGKPYTMLEMRKIVEYVTLNKLYSEVRGRRMWIDFANSKALDRTWQSMKETFLKRILPDIQNPYYKLTTMQISSFRQHHDVGARNNAVLDIVDIDSCGSNDGQKKEIPQHSVNGKEGDDNKKAGEEVKCSKIENRNRSSTDTLVLEQIDVAEGDEASAALDCETSPSTSKTSLKDLITYTEPLTPFNDFASDDDDPPMQIVENVEELPRNCQRGGSKSPHRAPESTTSETSEACVQDEKDGNTEENVKLSSPLKSQPVRVKSLKLKKTQNREIWQIKDANNDTIVTTANNDKAAKTDSQKQLSQSILSHVGENELGEGETNKSKKSIEDTCSSTPDTLLPNNQEELINKSDEILNSYESTGTAIETQTEQQTHKPQKKSKKKVKRNKEQEVEDNLHCVNNVSPSMNKEYDKENGKNCGTKNINNDSPKKSTMEQNSPKKTSTEINKVTDFHTKDKNFHDSQEAGPSHVKQTINDENPCLKSVSLFAERFSANIYLDTESENEDASNNKEEINEVTKSEDTSKNWSKSSNKIPNGSNVEIELKNRVLSDDRNSPTLERNINDVLLLKSHSDSDTNDIQPPSKKKITNGHATSITKRKQVIAHVLGFSSEKRPINNKSNNRPKPFNRRVHSRHFSNDRASESSDYSSLSYSDDSREQHRHRRRKRNYMKPHAHDIRSYPGEGGLFVCAGNKLYPLVKHGRNVKNFLTFSPDEDSAVDWKKLYMEEKQKTAEETIRADELARLLQQACQRNEEMPQTAMERYMAALNNNEAGPGKVWTEFLPDEDSSKDLRKNEELHPPPSKDEDRTVKIKITKDKEIELECKWGQMHPVLEQMAHLLHGGSRPEPSVIALSSSRSSPVPPLSIDKEVREKVNKLESEIFKEIEERDKAEVIKPVVNITNRKRSFKTPISLSPSNRSSKKAKVSNRVEEKAANTVATDAKKTEVQDEAKPTEKSDDGTSEEPVTKEKDTKDENAKENRDKDATETKSETENKDLTASEPVNNATTKRRASRSKVSASETTVVAKAVTKEATKKNVTDNKPEVETSSVGVETETVTGVESENNVTQRTRTKRRTWSPEVSADGSNPLPAANASKRQSIRNKTAISTRTSVEIPDDPKVCYMFPAASDLSGPKGRRGRAPPRSQSKTKHTYAKKPSKITTSPEADASMNGYQDSDVSPEILMFRRKRTLSTPTFRYNRHKSTLKRRSLRNPYFADVDTVSPPASLPDRLRGSNSSLDSEVYQTESYQLLMPKKIAFKKLSKIDENIPVRDEVAPETHLAVPSYRSEQNRSDSSKADGHSSNVSLPLSPELSVVENISLSQEEITRDIGSDLAENIISTTPKLGTDTNDNFDMTEFDVSLPLMQQNCDVQNSVNEEPSQSSLYVRLQNLLLESAKKMEEIGKDNVMMEVDSPKIAQVQKKVKGKHCSTPRKRKTVAKKIAQHINPVIEEHTESCSQGGRRSCPPTITVIDNENRVLSANEDEEVTNVNKRGRKKKDIIKVKIQRPRKKSLTRASSLKDKRTRSDSRLTTWSTDCTKDTESGIFLQTNDDSVELIHNHSETCLHTNDCLDDSVEIIDNKSKSVISLDSNSVDEMVTGCDIEDKLLELFSDHIHGADNINAAPQEMVSTSAGGAAQSLLSDSLNSLLTDDLSDEPADQPSPSKWYILSEDETRTCDGPGPTFVHSNLNQIFPEMCTVPNLSTITENTESNSERPTL